MKKLFLAGLFVVGTSSVLGTAEAQVAGTPKVGVTATELTEVAQGWSAKKSILDKEVYNDAGERIGNVEDLIIAPDKRLSYLIVGTGGFLGIGRHDVAIPITQIQDLGGKLTIPGASKDVLKGMPRFDYPHDADQRYKFVAAAEQDIAKAKAKVVDIEKKATAASADAKTKLERQVAELKKDLKTAEEKLRALKRSTASRWKELESDVNAAIARLRKDV